MQRDERRLGPLLPTVRSRPQVGADRSLLALHYGGCLTRSRIKGACMIGARERGSAAGRELDRIVNFSDAVFAIVITLLVLHIQVPNVHEGLVSQELPSRLLALSPKFLSYVISFLVIAVYWQAHHRVFRPIRSYDRTLLWLNFWFLMAISFLPFPTSLLGEYSKKQLSVVIYAATAAAASLLLASISWYATAGLRLVAPRSGRPGGGVPTRARLGGAGGVRVLDRDLLLESHGSYVLLVAVVRHRTSPPAGVVPLMNSSGVTLRRERGTAQKTVCAPLRARIMPISARLSSHAARSIPQG
jgi:uncharacterized membrane protein